MKFREVLMEAILFVDPLAVSEREKIVDFVKKNAKRYKAKVADIQGKHGPLLKITVGGSALDLSQFKSALDDAGEFDFATKKDI